MKTDWILIEEYCGCRHIEPDFIKLLAREGLIELEAKEEANYIPEDQLANLERFVSWHQDLDINVAGIDVIQRLLRMQQEMDVMRRRLSRLTMGDDLEEEIFDF